jgi:FlaA1/EpsC-like NDP-sugar epimerase
LPWRDGSGRERAAFLSPLPVWTAAQPRQRGTLIQITQRLTHLAVDGAVLAAALALAFLVRFDGDIPAQMLKRLAFLTPYVVGLQLLGLSAFMVQRFAWRYVGLREVGRILLALGAASAVMLALRIVAGAGQAYDSYWQYLAIPFGVIVADFFLSFLGVSGVRVARRIAVERSAAHARGSRSVAERTRTLLVGAGDAGVLAAREIAHRPDIGIEVVGFVDDDQAKRGMVLHGVKVLGPISSCTALSERYAVDQLVITISSASTTEMRTVVEHCRETGLPVRIIPGLYEIIDGRVNLSRIREVSIEHLLGRAAVRLETELIESFITGRRVVVTGGGGSIGSELARQVAHFRPERLVLAERSEHALFEIHRELLAAHPNLDLVPSFCDVCDESRVESLFAQHEPHVVFHAAAYKHVPLVEQNPGQAILNNIFGTKVVADTAARHGAEAFVLLSTDKAVNPSSIMGATKRVTEVYLQALSQRSSTKFVAVRFGNVLGSTGSVIPIFKEQIAKGGPVTVTHPEMCRYFMTIPEACQLVMQAGAMGNGGEIFVLDMGEPVRIVDLARDLIKFSGLEPDVDIDITYSGVRPGEKLFEELGFDAERMDKTRHPKIFTGRLSPHPWEVVESELERLNKLSLEGDSATVRAALRTLVPELREDAREEAP